MENNKVNKENSTCSSRDPRLILDVGGRLFYCHRSTLTNASNSYFARRFDPKSRIPPGDDYVDEKGRTVYFIDRDGDLFVYILKYLRTLSLPPTLGAYYENSGLWRELRMEADTYGLDGLSDMLKVTYSCSPDLGDKGVLYWLGTNKGTREYQNPFTSDAIHVGGWVDEETPQIISSGDLKIMLAAGRPESRMALVQYQPKIQVRSAEGLPFSVHNVLYSQMLWCKQAGKRHPVVIDLRSVRVRPTHYSLRRTACGMTGDWNFEASIDGNDWDVIHEARNDQHLRISSQPEIINFQPIFQFILDGTGEYPNDEEKSKILLSYMEQRLRHTWEVQSSLFYRYFRIIGASDLGENSGCLHGIGLELYGDVSESCLWDE